MLKIHNDDELPLIILKFEKLTNLIYEKNVQYEIYDPSTKNKVDIPECKNNPIFLYIPINMNKDSQFLYEDLKKNQYDFFNIKDPFYQDICTPYKTKNDTDILLSDRRKDYLMKEVIPQSNCEYVDYSSDKKYLKYKCKVDKESIDIGKINKFSGESTLTNFNKDLKNLNFKVLKCYKLVFNIRTITKNFGSIIVIILIILNICFAIIFIIKGISPLKLYIAKYLFEKPVKNNTNLTELNYPPKKKSKTTIMKRIKMQSESENDNVNGNENIHNNENKENSQNNQNNDNIINFNRRKKKAKTLKKHNPKTNKHTRKGKKYNTMISTKRNVIENTKNELKENVNDVNNVSKKEEKIEDYVLNNLEFNKALELDKRGYCHIYYSILKREHIILFTFFSWNDYNLFYIKFARFFFLLCTIMGMNVFFFFDKSLHNLYLKKGKYDFALLIPQIIFSSLVAHVSEIIICFLTMNDKYVYEVKNLEHNEMNRSNVMKTLKYIQIKLLLFFIFIFILMIFYWYLITSFCAVYENTQITFLLNFVFSFLLFLIYPLLLYILTSFCKYIGLKKQSSCLYKLGNIFPLF